jgi:signal transduction histidine kinase
VSLVSPENKIRLKSARPTRWIIAFTVAIGLLGTIGWLNLRHIERMQETAHWVDQTEHARDALDLLLLQLHNVQGNERGYVITGELGYLTSFQQAVTNTLAQFQTVQTLTTNNPAQRQQCEKLQGLVARVFLIASRHVNLRRKSGFTAAQQDIALGLGPKAMTDISAVLEEMDGIAQTSLESRSAAAQKEVQLTRFFTVSGTGVSFMMLGGVFFLVLRENKLRHDAQVKLDILNQELRARAVQIEAANKELESFSYSVSHDLRAPLRHVHGYVEMLQRATDGQLSDKAKRYLKTISDASIEMGQLIDDLLAFSRMGRVDMQETRVALEPLVREVVAAVERHARDRNITWKISPLPEVQGDPSMVKQVLINLIENSVKYTRKREHAVIEITTAGEEHGQTIFCVKDNGAGFDMKYAHKLFGVFQRLHRADEFEGTGIGLATVRRIIARHGGRTWAEGKLGEGASFYLTLKVVSKN